MISGQYQKARLILTTSKRGKVLVQLYTWKIFMFSGLYLANMILGSGSHYTIPHFDKNNEVQKIFFL